MAYARFGHGSDVYMFHNPEGFECHDSNEGILITQDAETMLAHLRMLENQGIKTGAAITRLAEEIAEGKW